MSSNATTLQCVEEKTKGNLILCWTFLFRVWDWIWNNRGWWNCSSHCWCCVQCCVSNYWSSSGSGGTVPHTESEGQVVWPHLLLSPSPPSISHLWGGGRGQEFTRHSPHLQWSIWSSTQGQHSHFSQYCLWTSATVMVYFGSHVNTCQMCLYFPRMIILYSVCGSNRVYTKNDLLCFLWGEISVKLCSGL